VIAVVQSLPVCYRCSERVQDPVFAPPFCDHERCASAVFHGVCLMEHREHMDEARKQWLQAMERHHRKECGCFDDQGNDARRRGHQ